MYEKKLMKILNNITYLIKIASLLISWKIVKKNNYSLDYDTVSNTYQWTWLKEMSKRTDTMLKNINFNKNKLLDLWCWTGYIIEKALQSNPNLQIHWIDISEKMLSKINTANKKLTISNCDLSKFLNNSEKDFFDIVTCAWVLSYVNFKNSLRLVYEVLKSWWQFWFVVNRKWTLSVVEQIIIDIMKKFPQKINKISVISLNLPRDYEYVKKFLENIWFKDVKWWDFESKFTFENWEDATDWLFKTWVLAWMFDLLELEDFRDMIAKWLEEYFYWKKIEIVHKFLIVNCIKW